MSIANIANIGYKNFQGNYGHVFKGWMERDNQESQRKEVAVKKLSRQASERNGTLYEDFKNELDIMKVKYLYNLSISQI